MRCLRCSKETESASCFCDRCLADMEQHPVRSDTPLFLPSKPAAAPKAPVRLRTQEDELRDLRRHLRALRIALCCTLVLSAVLAGAFYFYARSAPTSDNIGQNYSTAPSATSKPGSVAG